MTPVLILDGGLGTTLEDKFGVSFSSSTPLWSSHLLASDPDTLLRCQSDFGACPVDVIETATYQASIDGFANTRTSDSPDGVDQEGIPGFLEAAVRIANAAKGRADACVALSLGPYGACMIPSQEYSGVYDGDHSTAESICGWHIERLHCFSGISSLFARVQFVAFETMPRVDEIVAVRRLYDNINHDDRFGRDFVQGFRRTPFWISCVFPGDHERLPDGNRVGAAVEAMLSPAVSTVVPWGIGINCTKIHKLPSLITAYEDAVARIQSRGGVAKWPSLVLYPDGTNGEVYNTVTQRWELPEGRAKPETPWEAQLASIVKSVVARGKWASILVGGCCKTTPDDIKKLREAVHD